MKNKRLKSLVLAVGIAMSAGGIATGSAYANTQGANKVQVTNTDQMKLQKRACELINILQKDTTEKNIKESRKLISKLDDNYFRNSYKYIVDYYANKNVDKEISPIDVLINSYKNSLNIKSCNSKTRFNMNVKGDNLSNEEKEVLQGILPIINSMDISMDLKINSIKYNKKAKISGVIHFKNSFVNIDSRVWMDIDITKATPEVSYIIEIPQALKTFLPQEIADKKYFVFDMGSLLKNPKISKDKDIIDINKEIELSTMLQSKLTNDFQDFIKIADANYNIVSSIDKDKLNCNFSKNIKNAYEINLNNDKLIKVVKLGLHDKNISSTFWDCVNQVADLESNDRREKLTNEQKMEAVKAVENALDKFNKAVQCNIKSTVGVDEKGYNCYNKVTVNMAVDAKEIAKMLGAKEVPDTNSKYTLTVNCDCSISDINSNVKLEEKPEISKENSVDFSQILMDDNEV